MGSGMQIQAWLWEEEVTTALGDWLSTSCESFSLAMSGNGPRPWLHPPCGPKTPHTARPAGRRGLDQPSEMTPSNLCPHLHG